MARFVDLDESDEEPSHDKQQAYARRMIAAVRSVQVKPPPQQASESPTPTAKEAASRSRFAAALTCYPYAIHTRAQQSLGRVATVALSLSTHLDLNDLHSLSLVARSFHQSLSQYSRQLIAHSLRCTYNNQPLLSDLRKSSSNEPSDTRSATNDIHLSQHGQFSSAYKISGCARDLVAECRRCGTVVCRNCVVKAPSDRYLGDRHRRICKICLEAPLSAHLEHPKDDLGFHDSPPASSASSAKSTRSLSGSSHDYDAAREEASQTLSEVENPPHEAFLRDPCVCATRGVYLCATCGHNLRANDTTYKRVWTWRSRYSTHIGGGLGTGLGTGNQGQKCGRGDHCLSTSASSISWVEIDCSDGTADHGTDNEHLSSSRVGTPTGDRSSTPVSNRPGYLQQEVEGIGGVVKKKVKKRVKVGATVWEYDDERTSSKYLEREISGKERSWCGWCDRVCLGEIDRQAQT